MCALPPHHPSSHWTCHVHSTLSEQQLASLAQGGSSWRMASAVCLSSPPRELGLHRKRKKKNGTTAVMHAWEHLLALFRYFCSFVQHTASRCGCIFLFIMLCRCRYTVVSLFPSHSQIKGNLLRPVQLVYFSADPLFFQCAFTLHFLSTKAGQTSYLKSSMASDSLPVIANMRCEVTRWGTRILCSSWGRPRTLALKNNLELLPLA